MAPGELTSPPAEATLRTDWSVDRGDWSVRRPCDADRLCAVVSVTPPESGGSQAWTPIAGKGSIAMTRDDPRSRDLEARLRAAEDQLELLALEGIYGYAYDSRQGELWASLFTEDGIYEGRRWATVPAHKRSFVQGRANLAHFCEHDTNSGAHYIHAPYFKIDADAATGRVHFQILTNGNDEYGRAQNWVVSGYYDVAYVRTDAGWKIRRRVTTYMVAEQRTLYSYEASAAGLETIAEPYQAKPK